MSPSRRLTKKSVCVPGYKYLIAKKKKKKKYGEEQLFVFSIPLLSALKEKMKKPKKRPQAKSVNKARMRKKKNALDLNKIRAVGMSGIAQGSV